MDSVLAFDWLVENGFRVISINRPGYYGLNIKNVKSIELHAELVGSSHLQYLDT
ncbi:hypothetical protein [Clostridium sp.]|uniref:hypothetical protein n=1 Tax=Clostridium sp. TaxID=1506 RepID=UPI003F4C73A7